MTSRLPSIDGRIRSIDPIPFDPKNVQANWNEAAIALATKRAEQLDAFRMTYTSNGHSVAGFIVQPKHADGPLPCIIVNRGGTKAFGAITNTMVFGLFSVIASWGYVVFASQYSGGPGSEGQDEQGGADIDDVLALKDIADVHPLVERGNIGMYGGSRGGMMLYIALTKVPWIRAAVAAAATADLTRLQTVRPEMRIVFDECFGGGVEGLRERSAVCWPERFPANVPLLIMHGTADERVPVDDSIDLVRALLKSGMHPKLVLFDGDDHFFTKSKREQMRLTREWFDRYLKDRSAGQTPRHGTSALRTAQENAAPR